MPSPTQSQPAGDDLLANLAQTNNFSLDALAANRAGRLAPEQIGALRRRVIYQFMFGAVCVVVAGLIPVWFGTTATGLLVFGSSAILLLSGIGFLKAYKTFGDAQGGRVAMIEGRVTLHLRTNDIGYESTANYYYVVDGRQFQVSPAAYQALAEGRRYRVYYTPGSGALLSIEPARMCYNVYDSNCDT